MQDSETQAKTQSIVAMLSHPSVASNRAISKGLAKDVPVQLGVATKKKASNAATHQAMVPGDQLNSDDDDAEEDDNSDLETLSSGESSCARDHFCSDGEARRNCGAAVARGRARASAEDASVSGDAVGVSSVSSDAIGVQATQLKLK